MTWLEDNLLLIGLSKPDFTFFIGLQVKVDVADINAQRNVVFHAEGHSYWFADVARSGVSFQHGLINLPVGKSFCSVS